MRRIDDLLKSARKLSQEKNFSGSLSLYRRILEVNPRHGDALLAAGVMSIELGKEAIARSYFRRAAASAPSDYRAWQNLAQLDFQQSSLDTALGHANKSVLAAPENPEAYHALISILLALGRSQEALRHAKRVYRMRPNNCNLLLQVASLKRQVCDWDSFDEDDGRIRDFVAQGIRVPPLALMATQATNAEQHACALLWARDFEKEVSQQLPLRRSEPGKRVKVGYLSGDFHDHATSRLVAELFEAHDRSSVEVFGYSYGPNHQSDMRTRVLRSFDHFRDLRDTSSKAAAQLIYTDQIDILVDMKGYTSRARTEILSWRPAPIQVNYLGFPGTMGASFIDYVITDPVVSPPEYEAHSTERFAYLPNCFQPNDTLRPQPDGSVTRNHYGVSDNVFVFCCFNAAYKFAPHVFDRWMRILHAVPRSILCLLVRSEEQGNNLRSEACRRGIDPARLLLAPPAKPQEHLARCGLADLFLDTLPVSAFTTASDALWAGLPVLTCAGDTPAGRGSASLLTAMGLPELVTQNLDEYEQRAIDLAQSPDRLRILRDRIRLSRNTSPPFATALLARDLERLYIRLVADESQRHGGKRKQVA
ncbi:tetratricopeptide repeat protein [Aureimonas sp. AU4]|uniref:O-linked N-acetylglucosamine transferase, SPINDLY family protein n=1 Tax=Aureimonas sp. AU4 TaxID=1638163 RepID=UPI0009E85AD9|nr:hypothetical protein [Aureimonas sp. AU4]